MRGAWRYNLLWEELLNKDILEGEWKQMRGKVRSWWRKITNTDFARIAGNLETLTDVLQEKYGYTRQQAETEIDKRLSAYNANLSNDITQPRQ
jgi:uncharacterized protein YjbJ (UPF0337 family)